MRERLVTRFALPLLAALIVPLLPACGEDGSGDGEQTASGRLRPGSSAEAPVPAPPGQPFQQGMSKDTEVVRLVPGAPLPESFPSDLPAPSDAQQVAAFDGGPQHSTVAYEARRGVQQVLRDLEQGYLGAGWQVQVSSGSGRGLVFAQKLDHVVMADVSPTDSGGSRIEVSSITGEAVR